jgi:hypothetical protein
MIQDVNITYQDVDITYQDVNITYQDVNITLPRWVFQVSCASTQQLEIPPPAPPREPCRHRQGKSEK